MRISRSLLFLCAPLLLAALAGCPDKTPATADDAGATTTVTPSTTATPSAPASTPPAPSAEEAGAAEDSGAEVADAAMTKADAATASDSGAAAMSCGKKPLPDCPMQAWMKANTSAALQSKNFTALASALDQVAKMQPPGYNGWIPIANDGAKAARAQDIDGVKQSCKTCHNQFQKRYQGDATLRPKKI